MKNERTPEFTAIEWFRVKGRGFMASVERLPKDMWNPDDLTGRTVYINGELLLVTGVEKYAINYSEANPYRLPLGLLVEDTVQPLAHNPPK